MSFKYQLTLPSFLFPSFFSYCHMLHSSPLPSAFHILKWQHQQKAWTAFQASPSWRRWCCWYGWNKRSPRPLLCCMGFLWNRNMSTGVFSVKKEKPCLVVALSVEQFFLHLWRWGALVGKASQNEPECFKLYATQEECRAVILFRKRLGNCCTGEPTFAELGCVASDWVS